MTKQERVEIPDHSLFEQYPFIREQMIRCWRLTSEFFNRQGVALEEEQSRHVEITKEGNKLRVDQIQKNAKPSDIMISVSRGMTITMIVVGYTSDQYNPNPGFTCTGIELPVGKRGGIHNVVFQNWGVYEEATPYEKLVDWIEETLGYFSPPSPGG